MYNIRKASAGEVPDLIRIWEETVTATHCFLKTEEIAFYKSRMPLHFESADVYVYIENGEIKGFSGILGEMLEMLFVGERGSGFGSRLLGHAINLGVNKVDVNEENAQAAGFYLSKGFVLAGRSETDSDGKPHPILHLELNNTK